MTLKKLLDLTKPAGEILQLRFDKATANAIQSFKPKTHTIIEPDQLIAEEAAVWAKEFPQVTLLPMQWETALEKLGTFDLILIASDPIHLLSEGSSAMKEANELMENIEKMFPSLNKAHYTDEVLEGFCNHVSRSSPESLSRFLDQLEANGQITKKQHAHFNERHELPKSTPHLEQGSFFLPFLLTCLEKHMKKDSVFVSCLAASAYEDPRFFDEIATNPSLDVQELPLENAALALLIKKLVN